LKICNQEERLTSRSLFLWYFPKRSQAQTKGFLSSKACLPVVSRQALRNYLPITLHTIIALPYGLHGTAYEPRRKQDKLIDFFTLTGMTNRSLITQTVAWMGCYSPSFWSFLILLFFFLPWLAANENSTTDE